MPDDPYSLSDLASLADVTPRTIRYYVAQGLLPSPEAAGPATRYGDGHLQRLRLIRRLQRDHLPLAEIRARLERMGDEDVRELLDATEAPAPPAPAETLAYVRGLMTQSGVHPRVAEVAAPYAALRASATWDPVRPDAFPAPLPPAPATGSPARSPAAPMPASQPPATPAPRSGVGDRSTWERLVLAPDVELHIRRPLDRYTNKRVEQLVRIARELFDTEP
jgi:DNA-binding transcriptional MerR regulator